MTSPLVPPAAALVAGLAFGMSVSHPPEIALAALAICALASVSAFLRRRPVILLASVAAGASAAGYVMASAAQLAAAAPPLKALFDREIAPHAAAGEVVFVEGTLVEDARPTTYGASLPLWVSHVEAGGRRWPAEGGVRASVGGSFVGAHLDAWRSGRRIRAPVVLRRPLPYLNPGVPDQELALARRGTALLGTIKSAGLVDVVASGGWLEERAADVRAAVRRLVAATVGAIDERSAGIVKAILIGDRAGLDETTERRLQEAGTYHVIAISGGNVAILAGLVLLALRAGGVSPRAAAVAAAAVLTAYAYVIVSEASVVRATFAAVTYLSARAIDHRADALNVLALTALVLLAASPLAAADGAFVLSFGATLGLLAGGGPLVKRAVPALERLGPRTARWLVPLVGLGAATVAVEAALLPVSATLFSRVSFAGFALNFLAIPLMTLVQVSGGLACLLAPLAAPLALAAAWLAHASAWLLVESARLVDYVPWLVRRVPPPPLILLGIYYLAWLAVLTLRHRTGALGGRALPAVIAASLVWMLAAPAPAHPRLLRVTFLDVGQGDATVVQFPGGRAMLVDAAGGPGAFDLGARILAPALWALGVRRLDYLALTHGDPDHVGSAAAVVRDFRPREVWEGVPVPPHEPMREIAARAALAGSVWRQAIAGERLFIDGVEIRILHPTPPDWERQKVRNDDSIVIELRYGRIAVLLPGDIGREVEPLVAARLEPAPLRIVKAPHHGSGGSSSPAFVAAAAPRFVVFSAGRANRYGHPAPAVVERYRRARAELFRTDADGATMLATDGQVVTVTTMRGRSLRLLAPG